MVFRKSTFEDIDAIVAIAEDAKRFLRENGVSQWQRGTYPDRAVFEQDVADGIGYVVEEQGQVAAFCAVTFTDEASYHTLRDGAWLSGDNEIYATVHRSATARSMRGKGVIRFLFQEVMKLAADREVSFVRVDTHMDNHAMQNALEKTGFIKCGVLTLTDGDEIGDLRFGYEIGVPASLIRCSRKEQGLPYNHIPGRSGSESWDRFENVSGDGSGVH